MNDEARGWCQKTLELAPFNYFAMAQLYRKGNLDQKGSGIKNSAVSRIHDGIEGRLRTGSPRKSHGRVAL
jgi:hypothetical protein